MGTISHIDHIAIAVTSISQVREFYESALGLKITHVEDMPERGIRTAFISVGNTKIELIEPINSQSEISTFLAKRGAGIHHIAFKTDNVDELTNHLRAHNVCPIYETARPGAHCTRINFIHPKDTGGALVEIVE